MKRALLLAVVVVLVPLTLSAQTTGDNRPTLVLLNAKVFTADPAKPWAEAVAIQGSKILAVGTMAEIRRLVPDDPKFPVIDLRGRVVIPGINDAHTHPGDAATAFRPSIGFDVGWSEAQAAIANAIDETPGDMWIVGTLGPRLASDPSLTRTQLDKLAPGRKIILRSFTGHGAVLSSAAMAALGVGENAVDPPGGSFGRDESGRLNGRVSEYAQWALDRRFYNLATDDELVDSVRSFAAEALQYGITSVQAMPNPDEARFMKAWRAAGVPIRLRVINFPTTPDAPLVTGARGLKWIFDGTPIERGAAVRKPYSGGGQGSINFKDIAGPIKRARETNQQLLVHASGDETIARLLAAMNAISPNEWAAKRPRIEHGDGLQRDLFDATKRLGIVVVQNPSHFPFRGAFPAGDYMLAKSIVDAGIPLAFGSDGPLNPFLNIMFATDRPDLPAEALTREQAVTAYTATAAYAEFEEGKKGKIAPGMLADLAVLSDDVFKSRIANLPEIRSVMTIIDGKIVYQNL